MYSKSRLEWISEISDLLWPLIIFLHSAFNRVSQFSVVDSESISSYHQMTLNQCSHPSSIKKKKKRFSVTGWTERWAMMSRENCWVLHSLHRLQPPSATQRRIISITFEYIAIFQVSVEKAWNVIPKLFLCFCMFNVQLNNTIKRESLFKML